MIARENGLEPLLRAILDDRRAAAPEALARAISPRPCPTAKAALDGARDILVEELAENAGLLGQPARLHAAPRPTSRRAWCPAKRTAGAQVLRLFRPSRDMGRHPRPPGAGHPARPPSEGDRHRRHRARSRNRRAARHWHDRRRNRHPGRGPGRPLAARRRGLGLAGQAEPVDVSRPDGRAAPSAPRRRPSRVFARNLSDLLLAAPAGPRRPWGSTPAFAPGSRWRWSTRPASCSRPRRSIPSSRRTTCAGRRVRCSS